MYIYNAYSIRLGSTYMYFLIYLLLFYLFTPHNAPHSDFLAAL